MTGVIVSFPNDQVTAHSEAADWRHEAVSIDSNEAVTKLVDEKGNEVGVEMPFNSYSQIQTATDAEVAEIEQMLEW